MGILNAIFNTEPKSPQQEEWTWFPANGETPSAESRREWLDPDSPTSPYYGFIGNRKAVNKLVRIDFDALGNFNHNCSSLSVAFIGPAGSGKTELERRHAYANGLPHVTISPKAAKTTHDIFKEIERVCYREGLPLVECGYENHYELPPMNVFIDEVHALSDNVVQGLLKPLEHDDGILVTEKGVTASCRNIHWMIATTDRGRLFDAFDTRFTKVHLNLYKKDEIAKIVQYANPEWDFSVCKLVAHFCSRIPREALTFAREMQLEQNMNPASWEAVAKKVADDNEIDVYGMTFKRLAILKALGTGPVAEKRLPIVAGVKPEELDKFIMPWLLESTEDQSPYLEVSTRGYSLTEAGLKELDLRQIPNDGERALVA